MTVQYFKQPRGRVHVWAEGLQGNSGEMELHCVRVCVLCVSAVLKSTWSVMESGKQCCDGLRWSSRWRSPSDRGHTQPP